MVINVRTWRVVRTPLILSQPIMFVFACQEDSKHFFALRLAVFKIRIEFRLCRRDDSKYEKKGDHRRQKLKKLFGNCNYSINSVLNKLIFELTSAHCF